jgi:hypothetical protein
VSHYGSHILAVFLLLLCFSSVVSFTEDFFVVIIADAEFIIDGD